MTSTRDVVFEHDYLYYILDVFNKKIMLMMTLMKMDILFSNTISYQHWINHFQECQQNLLLMNSVDG